MDFGEPIGLGKTGNNPYSLGALGVGLATGGRGIIPSLTQMLMGGNDPQQLGQFLAASEVQGRPVTSIPREGGMLPMLLSRIGLMSPNIKATPNIQNLETLALRSMQQERMKSALSGMTALSQIADKAGPQAASQIYKSLGLDQTFPELDPTKWQVPELIKSQEEANRLASQQVRDDVRNQQQNRRLDISQQQANTSQAREEAMANRLNKTDTRLARTEDMQMYTKVLSNLGANYRNMMGDPESQKEMGMAINFLSQQMTAGVPAGQAYALALQKYPKALMMSEAPTPTSGPNAMSRFFSSINPFGASNASTTSGPSASPTPTIVRPDFTR